MSGPWPERWLIDSAEEFNIKTLEELNNSKWVKVLNESVSVEIQGYINSMEKAIEIINSTDGLEPYLDSFISELSQIKSIYENINNGLEKMYIGILSINFGKLKPIKKDKVSDQNAQNLVKNIRDDIKREYHL